MTNDEPISRMTTSNSLSFHPALRWGNLSPPSETKVWPPALTPLGVGYG